MAMNIPPEENPQTTTPVQPEAAPTTAPIEQTPVPPEATTSAEQAPPEQTASNDQQVVEEVAQGLADEEITAEDIMVAVLSDSLGLTPNGARSLFQLLMQDLIDEAATEEPPVEQPPME